MLFTRSIGRDVMKIIYVGRTDRCLLKRLIEHVWIQTGPTNIQTLISYKL